jgi:Tol biopolymer transport system component/erythromycin esterase-like protein
MRIFDRGEQGHFEMKSYLLLITSFVFILTISACTSVETPTATQTSSIDLTPTIASTPTPIGGGTGQIVFSSYREGESEIFTMSSDGSEVNRLTEDAERLNQPNWSPDGKYIAYVRRVWPTNLEIYVIRADGSDPIRLTYNLNAFDIEPDWSPDGSMIAFTSSKFDNLDILTMRLDDFQQIQLTENPGADTSPDWSPDGERIVYRSERDGNNEIFFMQTDGAGQMNLTKHIASDTDPAWSPNGERIAFVSEREGFEDIYVMDADGSNPTRLTTCQCKDTYPAWSPDGRLLAFYSDRSGNFEVYVMNVDGSNQTQITHHNDFDGFPDWQPSFSSLKTEAIHPPYTVDPKIADWLMQNAIPILSWFDEVNFGPIMGLFDDIKIVGLGEANLGSHESFEIRRWLSSALMYSGFNNLILPMEWDESVVLNDFINNRNYYSRELLIDLDNWIWSTQGMSKFLNDVSFANLTYAGGGLWLTDWRTVSIYGFYNFPPSLPMDRVVEFLQTVDPKAAQDAQSHYECFRRFEPDWFMYSALPVDTKNQCAKDLLQVYEELSSHQEEYVEASGRQEYAFALLSAEFVGHLEEQYRIEDPELQNQLGIRNTAESIRWLFERDGHDAKMIVWAPNDVIADLGEASSGIPSSIGSYLRDFYGDEMIAIGFTFHSGDVNARSYDTGNPVIAHQVHPPPPNSFEWMAHHVGMSTFFLDFREIDLNNHGASWLDQPLYLHCIGEYYNPESPEDYLCEYYLPTAFDAIIYTDQVTPTRILAPR